MKNLEEIVEFIKHEIQYITLDKYLSIHMSNGQNFAHDFHMDSLDYAQLILSGESFVQLKLNEDQIDWRKLQTIQTLAESLYACQQL